MGGNQSSKQAIEDPTEKAELYDESGVCKFFRDPQTKIEYEKYFIQNDGSSDFENKYEFRVNNHSEYLVNAYYARASQNAFGCNFSDKYEVVIERMPSRLRDFKNLSPQKSLNFVNCSLRGFNQIYKSLGLILVRDTMIGVNNSNKVKVWMNQNFAINSPETQPISYSMLPAEQKQSTMVDNIIDLVNSRSQRAEPWTQFIDEKYNRGRMSFIEAINLVNKFLKKMPKQKNDHAFSPLKEKEGENPPFRVVDQQPAYQNQRANQASTHVVQQQNFQNPQSPQNLQNPQQPQHLQNLQNPQNPQHPINNQNPYNRIHPVYAETRVQPIMMGTAQMRSNSVGKPISYVEEVQSRHLIVSNQNNGEIKRNEEVPAAMKESDVMKVENVQTLKNQTLGEANNTHVQEFEYARLQGVAVNPPFGQNQFRVIQGPPHHMNPNKNYRPIHHGQIPHYIVQSQQRNFPVSFGNPMSAPRFDPSPQAQQFIQTVHGPQSQRIPSQQMPQRLIFSEPQSVISSASIIRKNSKVDNQNEKQRVIERDPHPYEQEETIIQKINNDEKIINSQPTLGAKKTSNVEVFINESDAGVKAGNEDAEQDVQKEILKDTNIVMTGGRSQVEQSNTLQSLSQSGREKEIKITLGKEGDIQDIDEVQERQMNQILGSSNRLEEEGSNSEINGSKKGEIINVSLGKDGGDLWISQDSLDRSTRQGEQKKTQEQNKGDFTQMETKQRINKMMSIESVQYEESNVNELKNSTKNELSSQIIGYGQSQARESKKQIINNEQSQEDESKAPNRKTKSILDDMKTMISYKDLRDLLQSTRRRQ